MKHPVLALALLGTAVGLVPLLAGPRARAEDGAAEKLTTHPMKDAKPGEFLRYVEESDGWKKYFVERVIDVKDGKVYWQVAQTDEEGTKDLATVRGAWYEVPEFGPGPYQKVLKDEMQVLTVDGKPLNCRYVFVEQPVEPPYPEPSFRREVWYSNDVPCSGKVREVGPQVGTRTTLSWGMMSAEELKRRQDALNGGKTSGSN